LWVDDVKQPAVEVNGVKQEKNLSILLIGDYAHETEGVLPNSTLSFPITENVTVQMMTTSKFVASTAKQHLRNINETFVPLFVKNQVRVVETEIAGSNAKRYSVYAQGFGKMAEISGEMDSLFDKYGRRGGGTTQEQEVDATLLAKFNGLAPAVKNLAGWTTGPVTKAHVDKAVADGLIR